MTNFAILIPAYQPDSKLNKLIKDITLDSYFQNVQIVVVDDGSGIEYDPIFNAISSSTSLIRYDKNEGKGFALKTGFKFIKDHLKSVEAVVTIDADGQHTVGDTKKCLQEYERNAQKYPLILGSRNFGKNIPLEQVWAEIRKRGFKNKVFKTLEEVIDKLQEVILSLHWSVLKSILNRRWTRDIYF